MSNQIVEQFFSHQDFGPRIDEVAQIICRQTGFQLQSELWRGLIMADPTKVGSVIYRGIWNNQAVVLKIQALKLEIEEADLLQQFTEQNTSQRIRTPHIYHHQAWSETLGYGFTISEFLTAHHIFSLPFANEREQLLYCDFYQEYRTKAIAKPFLPVPSLSTIDFVQQRLTTWLDLANEKNSLAEMEYLEYAEEFKNLIPRLFSETALEFCHGHLTAHDIRYDEKNDQFILTSNILWGFRPQWYDLAFNLWACFMHIRDTGYTFENLIAYYQQWLQHYKKMAVLTEDQNFEKKFTACMLERTIGSIVADLGANESFIRGENHPFQKHLLRLQQQFFHYLIEKL